MHNNIIRRESYFDLDGFSDQSNPLYITEKLFIHSMKHYAVRLLSCYYIHLTEIYAYYHSIYHNKRTTMWNFNFSECSITCLTIWTLIFWSPTNARCIGSHKVINQMPSHLMDHEHRYSLHSHLMGQWSDIFKPLSSTL